MREYKIYCLRNPKSKEIRYIGVTSQKYLSTRLCQHVHATYTRNSKTHVCNWIRTLSSRPLIELIEICNKTNWAKREKYWISYYDNLTNIKEGGNGVFIDRTSESIVRSANAHKKPIVQLNEQGEFISLWTSINEATSFHNGKSKSSISNVLRGKAPRAFGYQWFYLEEYLQSSYCLRKSKSKINYDKLKKMYLYDLNNKFLKKYSCLYQLSKELGCAYSSARKAFKNNRPLLKQYYVRDYMI